MCPSVRSVLLSQLVDTQTFKALQSLIDSHPSTALATDASTLLATLTPYLYSS